MTIQEGPDTSRQQAIRSEYPVVEGRTLGTTKLKDDWILEPEEESLVSDEEKVGLR